MKINKYLIFLLILCNACSIGKGELKSSEAADAESVAEQVSAETPPPVDVSVIHAFYDKNALNVKVRVDAREKIPTKDVVVGIYGLREGEQVEKHLKLLSEETTAAYLDENESLAFRFNLNEPDLSEYQVRLSWGLDAQPVLAKLSEKIVSQEGIQRARLADTTDSGSNTTDSGSKSKTLKPFEDETLERRDDPDPIAAIIAQSEQSVEVLPMEVILENINIDKQSVKCSNPPCDLLYTVSSNLINRTNKTLKEVTLGLGLYWAADGEKPIVPAANAPLEANEEEINIEKLLLKPKGEKLIKVEVDQPVPPIPGGGFVPHLRIVKYKH